MKLLTTNFLTCAIKACKSSPASYPLHFRDAELATSELDYNPQFLRNIVPRLDWTALVTTADELSLSHLLPPTQPTSESTSEPSTEPTSGASPTTLGDDTTLRGLHKLLMETEVVEGKLVCGNCGHEYRIKEGVANFLLPGHLV